MEIFVDVWACACVCVCEQTRRKMLNEESKILIKFQNSFIKWGKIHKYTM